MEISVVLHHYGSNVSEVSVICCIVVSRNNYAERDLLKTANTILLFIIIIFLHTKLAYLE